MISSLSAATTPERASLDDRFKWDLSKMYVNLVEGPERSYPFPQGRELVLEGVKSFGPEYGAVMKQAFDSRWIDVYENKGKRSGAYNLGTYLSAPYVLLNYQSTFQDVSTLAHELGHATQSWFAKENQPPVYAGYPMFTAEVASTAAEIVFKKSLLDKTQNPKERAFLINQMLEDMGALFSARPNSPNSTWPRIRWLKKASR
jgi:oligoendopeptidase F